MRRRPRAGAFLLLGGIRDLKRPRPATVLLDDLVDRGHEADGFGEGHDVHLV